MKTTGRRILMACGLGATLMAHGAWARVNVSVNIGVPVAPVVVPASPEVVLIPGTPVYYVPEVSFDLFFTDGYWWTARDGRWLRARDCRGPWRSVGPRYVPRAITRVPRDYRTVYVDEERIPYGQWKKHWREHEHREREGHRRGGWREHGKGGRHGDD